MSRRPGIGAHARQHWQSWRLYAVNQGGTKQPVPRYYHEAWKKNATQEQKDILEYEKQQMTINKDNTQDRLNAQNAINEAQHALKALKRTLD